MDIQLKERAPKISGRIGCWDVNERTGLWLPRWAQTNQIQFLWGFCVAQCFRGLLQYRPAALYVEFENVGDPNDPVDVPDSFGRDEQLCYYHDLASSGVRDYLRVPLIQDPMLGITPGFEAFFTEGLNGNLLTYFAQTAGNVGVTGKTYSNAVNSKACGVALVATPIPADPTQDVIFARTYWPVDQQVVKAPSGQVGITWQISME